MQIKTTCLGCRFFTDKCTLDQRVEWDHHSFTYGYCGFRRPRFWNQEIDSEDILADLVCDDYSFLSVIISHIGKSVEDLEKTVEGLKNHPSCLKKVLLVCKNEQNSENLIDVLSTIPNCFWDVLNINYEGEIEDLAAINYIAIEKVKTTWFYSVVSGEEINDNIFELFLLQLALHPDSEVHHPICMYFDESDPIHMFIPNGAFQDLHGHMEENWFDKVKKFDNWQDHSIRIDV